MSEINAPAQKSVAKARGKSRRMAMQAVYQWQMTGDSITGIKQQFFEDSNPAKVDIEYFSELVSGVASNLNELDSLLEKYMSRTIESVDTVERAILRLASYEFVNRLDVPYRVVINEALELAKVFGAQDSYKYVNGVLDSLAPKLREFEVAARKK